MTPYQREELQNIRRLAERGKALSEDVMLSHLSHLDLYNEIISRVGSIEHDAMATREQADDPDVRPAVVREVLRQKRKK